MKNIIQKASLLITIAIVLALGCRSDENELIASTIIPAQSDFSSFKEKKDSLRDGVIDNLFGNWTIDTLKIDYKDNYFHNQAGLTKDTIFTDFGSMNFDVRTLKQNHYDTTNYTCTAVLNIDNEEYPIIFDYLLYSPSNGQVFSLLHKDYFANPENWDESTGWFLQNVGILDNTEIIRMSDTKFKILGLNNGVKEMVLVKD